MIPPIYHFQKKYLMFQKNPMFHPLPWVENTKDPMFHPSHGWVYRSLTHRILCSTPTHGLDPVIPPPRDDRILCSTPSHGLRKYKGPVFHGRGWMIAPSRHIDPHTPNPPTSTYHRMREREWHPSMYLSSLGCRATPYKT